MISEICVLWDRMMCRLIGASPFQMNLQPPSSADFSEPLVPVYETTQCHISQKHNIKYSVLCDCQVPYIDLKFVRLDVTHTSSMSGY